jgi:transcription-repair coupling factor (superfamily II helicase)
MNDEARKRLTAIEDFTALGSGYKIALRDLSIRGAGDLLGQEQSGFIDSVGYELYTKLVEEAITGKDAFQPIDPKDNEVFAPRHIDPEYVPFDEVRIEIHKRISELNSLNDAQKLKDELLDRFGPIDSDLRLYMYEKLFKKLSHRLGIIKTDHGIDTVKFTFSLEATQENNNKTLIEATKAFEVPVKLDFERGHIVMKLSTKELKEHWLYTGSKLFENLLITFSK